MKAIEEIKARHADSVRLLVAPAEGAITASVYEEADGLDTICAIPDHYQADVQNALAESIARMWQDRADLLSLLGDE